MLLIGTCFICQQQKDEEVKYPGRAKGASDESVYRVFNDFMNNFRRLEEIEQWETTLSFDHRRGTH